MPKTLKNKYDEKLTYENLMEAHIKSKKGKGYRIENINFYLKQEEYLMYLYQELKNMTYKHGGYTVFCVVEPKVRKIEKSRYIDRIVHRWLVDNFLEPTFVSTFINSSFACLKGRGMHRAALYVQACMRKAKNKWDNYYILKMDVAKYFDSINKKILLSILERKIKDEKVMWLVKEILYSQPRDKGKRKLKKKVKYLTGEIYKGNMTSKEAKKYLAGHLGYIKYANTNNLLNKIFYKGD